jgi:hypothetical protein
LLEGGGAAATAPFGGGRLLRVTALSLTGGGIGWALPMIWR